MPEQENKAGDSQGKSGVLTVAVIAVYTKNESRRSEQTLRRLSGLSKACAR